MSDREKRLLAGLRKAIEKLSDHYRSPRALEADMDILALALTRLPERLTHVSRDDAAFTLSDVIEQHVEHGNVSAGALDAVENLEELTQVADYDVPAEDRFAERVGEKISVLKAELESLLAKFEDEQCNGSRD